MHQSVAVNVGKSVQDWWQHVARFRGAERPVRKDLGQILFRIFHHHEKQISSAEMTSPHLKQLNKLRMEQLRCQLPLRDLNFRGLWIRGNKFDDRLPRSSLVKFGKEYGAVVRTSQVLAQMEFSIDDLAFAFFPSLGHCSCLSAKVAALLYASAHAANYSTVPRISTCRRHDIRKTTLPEYSSRAGHFPDLFVALAQ
jgi:hypothetical protein